LNVFESSLSPSFIWWVVEKILDPQAISKSSLLSDDIWMSECYITVNHFFEHCDIFDTTGPDSHRCASHQRSVTDWPSVVRLSWFIRYLREISFYFLQRFQRIIRGLPNIKSRGLSYCQKRLDLVLYNWDPRIVR
jgi:hypothetical protein